MTAEQIRQARGLVTLPGNSIASIARLLGVSRSTIYKYLPELAAGHHPAARPRPGRSPGPAGHHGGTAAATAAGSANNNPRRSRQEAPAPLSQQIPARIPDHMR